MPFTGDSSPAICKLMLLIYGKNRAVTFFLVSKFGIKMLF